MDQPAPNDHPNVGPLAKRIGLVGSILVWAAVSAAFLVIGLGVSQIRSRLNAVLINNSAYSLWDTVRLINAQNELAATPIPDNAHGVEAAKGERISTSFRGTTLEEALAIKWAHDAELARVKSKSTKCATDIPMQRAKARERRQWFIASEVALARLVQSMPPLGKDPSLDTSVREFFERQEKIKDAQLVAQDPAEAQRLTKIIQDLYDFAKAIEVFENAANECERQIKDNERALDRLTALQKYEPTMVVDFLIKKSNPSEEERRMAETYLYEVSQAMNSLGMAAALLTLPAEMLTLLLVLSGGMFGRCLQLITLLLLSHRNDTSVNALDPFIGASVALALFILVKAGVLVASDLQNGRAVADLNPFFITFIGLVSGLMSEQVVERIRSLAGDWLGKTAIDQPRYANSQVDVLLTGAERKIEDLARLLGEPVDDVKQWVSGTTAVQSRQQALIAAWLDKPIGELFSDLKSRGKS